MAINESKARKSFSDRTVLWFVEGPPGAQQPVNAVATSITKTGFTFGPTSRSFGEVFESRAQAEAFCT